MPRDKNEFAGWSTAWRSLAATWGLLVLLSAGPIAACEIPVFRYALERWPPDVYQLLILHRGPLKPAEAQLAERLEKMAGDAAQPANVRVVRVDLAAASSDPFTQELKKQHAALSKPRLVLVFPNAPVTAPPAWAGPLSAPSIAAITDSPMRREIVRQLVNGQSAVWILLESGHPNRDEAAAALLRRELEKNSKTLKLPDPTVLATDEFYKPDTKVMLKVAFSLLRLKRTDPAEAVLRAMLVGSEPDLKDFDAPLAIPVFGRGRAAFALVGKGITPDEIGQNCQFVVGRCSCQVKRENPGVDLLLAADWDKLIGSSAIAEGPLPELSGLGVILTDPESDPKSTPGAGGLAPVTPPAGSPGGDRRGPGRTDAAPHPAASKSGVLPLPALPKQRAAPVASAVSTPAPLPSAARASGRAAAVAPTPAATLPVEFVHWRVVASGHWFPWILALVGIGLLALGATRWLKAHRRQKT